MQSKKLFASLCLGTLLLTAPVLLPAADAAPQTVNVRAETKSSKLEDAMLMARRDAVAKVLEGIITPEELEACPDVKDILLARPEPYILQFTTFKSKRSSDHSFVEAAVKVDADLLQAEAAKLLATEKGSQQ